MQSPPLKPITCLGICTVDLIAQTVHQWPTPGGLQLFDRYAMVTGGCAVNAAVDLAKLGLPVHLATKVGPDAFGRYILDQCAAAGVDVSSCLNAPTGHTPLTFVALHPGGQRSFVHTMGTNATLEAEELEPALAAAGAGLVFVAGLGLMPALEGPPLAGLLAAARSASPALTTLADTVHVDTISREDWARRLDPVLPQLDYFLPSWPEARAITGCADPQQAAVQLASRGARRVCIKLDAGGVLARDADGSVLEVPAFQVDRVVDTTGAGDSWCAGFLAGLSTGRSLAEACRLGNATAAHCIQAVGASTGIPALAVVEAYARSAAVRRG